MITVFTPTAYYGGLAETYNCLRSQTVSDEIVWIIADELYDERKHLVRKKTRDLHTVHMKVKKEKGHRRNLAKAYNLALEFAREKFHASMFVSLQDHIWIPPNALRKFKIQSALYPNNLLAGVMSIYPEPGPDKITNLGGLWTIFDTPYISKPSGEPIFNDPRAQYGKDTGSRYYPMSGMGWEANWSAISYVPLHDKSLNFDEVYDEAVAYENCDFGMTARALGYETIIDSNNQAYGFPHKKYWPELESSDLPYTKTNMARFHKKWDIPLPDDYYDVADANLVR